MVSMVAVLVAVGYAAVSQGNGPAYLPTYALLSLLLISWLHNRANVQQLELTAPREAHGFAGAVLLLPFTLRNKKKRAKFGLQVRSSLGGNAKVGKLSGEMEGNISVPGLPRGIHQVAWLEATSIFPLGVFRSRTRKAVSCECAIYPEAVGELGLPVGTGSGQPEKTGVIMEGDDFVGVRTYLTGESQRHIDWKAVARGQPMMVKQFASTAKREIWLHNQDLRGVAYEAQLSQLARWIMQSERTGLRYGLSAFGASVPPGQGNTHYHRCLRALAALPGQATAS